MWLTAAKWPTVIERPIARGAEPLTSVRRESQTPWTTKTRINVIRASTRTPWPAVTPTPREDVPSPPMNATGTATWNVNNFIKYISYQCELYYSVLEILKFFKFFFSCVDISYWKID